MSVIVLLTILGITGTNGASISPLISLQTSLINGNISVLNSFHDGVFYYADPTLGNYEASQSLCRRGDQEADLAIIKNMDVYNVLRLGNFPAGTYWINGKEEGGNRKFDLVSACDVQQNLDGIDVRSPTSAQMCLALVKGSSVTNRYLQLQPCLNRYQALCGIPLKCEQDISTTSATSSPTTQGTTSITSSTSLETTPTPTASETPSTTEYTSTTDDATTDGLDILEPFPFGHLQDYETE